jgi:hypothetical protein
VSPGCTGIIRGHHHRAVHAVEPAGETHHPLLGSLGVAFGKSDGGLHRHGVDVGIAARPLDFAQDEEWPVGFDFDADFGVLDVFALQLRGDVGGELVVSPRALTGPISGSDTVPFESMP